MSEDQPARSQTTVIKPGQIWTPAVGKRARAREVVRLTSDLDGYPTVIYSPFWRNCGHTGTSRIRAAGFRTWIRKMQATCEMVDQHGQ